MIALFLILIAGMANGTMDILDFHYDKSIFPVMSKFWDAQWSWENKYSNLMTEERKKWFNLIPIPVFLTDGWHLMKFIMLNSLILGIILYCYYNNCLSISGLTTSFIIIRSIFGIGFVLMYNLILIKK